LDEARTEALEAEVWRLREQLVSQMAELEALRGERDRLVAANAQLRLRLAGLSGPAAPLKPIGPAPLPPSTPQPQRVKPWPRYYGDPPRRDPAYRWMHGISKGFGFWGGVAR